MKLENRIGKLAEIYRKLDPDTIQQSDEITTERQTNEDLRGNGLWTANLGLYRIDDAKLRYGIGCRKTFNKIAGQDIKKFCEQLIGEDNYLLTNEQITSLDELGSDILWVAPSGLELEQGNDEYCYFKINTVKYDEGLNQEQRKIAEKVYGQGNDFKKNMEMFKDVRIDTTKIFVLNPSYVKTHVKGDSVIARVCWLYSFGNDSDFGAGDWGVGSSSSCLRGVPKVAEGDTRKINYADAINLIVKNQSEALKYVDAKEAAGFLNLANQFYNSKKQ